MTLENLPQLPSTLGKPPGVARGPACLPALAGLAGSLWAALGSGACGNCHAVGALVAGFPLAWTGAGFYTILAAMAASTGFARWTKIGYLAAAGVHVVLLGLLLREKILCGGCLLAGSAALLGAAASLAARPREARWALPAFAVSALLALVGVVVARQFQPPPHLDVPPEAQSQPAGTPPVKLVVYEREGCRHCLEFEEQMLPRLRADLGAAFDVERRAATVTMESPTIEVVGRETREFSGLPEIQELEDAIQAMRQGAPPEQPASQPTEEP